MRLGIGLAITDRFGSGARAYDWQQHFSAGQQGYVLLANRLDTLFQDEAGSTPLTTAGQTCGRWLDVSGRGNHFTQATAGSRAQWLLDGGGLPMLRADGVDDFMQSGTIDPGATDKVWVMLALRKRSDAATGIALESGTNASVNNGSFHVTAPNNNATGNYGFRSRGTIQNTVAASGFVAPVTSVVTGLGDISGDSAILRVDGVQRAVSTVDLGTGNFLSHIHYLARRAGTSLPAPIDVYGVFCRYGALPDAAERDAAEREFGRLCGVTF